VAAAGGCAAVIAGALVVADVHNSGQRVTVSPAAHGPGPVPGTIFVANSTVGLPSGQPVGAGPGSITVYPPGATGNARPEAVITAGIDGPIALAVDAAGNLWVANATSSTVVEYSRAELATASPAPTVTISGPPQTILSQLSGLAFDAGGRLWLSSGRDLLEYGRAALAKSATGRPRAAVNRRGRHVPAPVEPRRQPSRRMLAGLSLITTKPVLN
jgi:hypothetical protein